jgi:exonuclease SbcC
MRPEKLVLENFGPFVGTVEIDFSGLDDIFLITGVTGSGKTTIFDAICFALYGTVPGTREGHTTKLRSDHAPAEQRCSVVFEFSILSLNDKRYRVCRGPGFERQKKRGEGTIAVPEELALDEIIDGVYLPFNLKKSEVDQKLEQLIGLKADEFCKFVLLPQGEFAQFLSMKSDDRRQVLGKLFPVDRATKLMRLAADKAKAAKDAASRVAHRLEELMLQITPETYFAQLAQIDTRIAVTEERLIVLAEQSELLRHTRILQIHEAELCQMSESLYAEQNRTLHDADRIEEYRRKLFLSRQAAPLMQQVNAVEYRHGKVQQAQVDTQRTEHDRTIAEHRFKIARAQTENSADTQKRLRDLQDMRPVLKDLLAEEEKQRQKMHEIDEKAVAGNNLSKELRRLDQSVQEKDAIIREAQAVIDQYPDSEVQYDQAREQLDQLKSYRLMHDNYEKISTEERRCCAEMSVLAGSIAKQEAYRAQVQQDVQKLEHEQKTQDILSMANRLREQLRPGEPCPVCGSRHHLNTAPELELYDDKISARLESQKAALETAVQELAGSTGTCKAKKDELSRIEQDLSGVRESLLRAQPDFLSLTARDLAGIYNAYKDELAVALGHLDAVRQARRRLDAVNPELNKLRDERAQKQIMLNALDNDCTILTEQVQHIQERCRQYTGTRTVAEKLTGVDRELQELQSRLERIQQQQEQATQELTRAETRYESTRKQYDDAYRDYQDAESALNIAVAGSAFSDAAAVKNAAIPPEKEQTLHRFIADWEQKCTQLETRIAGVEHDLKQCREQLKAQAVAEALSDTENRQAAVAAEQKTAQSDHDRALIERTILCNTMKQYNEVREEAARCEREKNRLTLLSDTLNGNDRTVKKISFESWLLIRYLDEVTRYASKRLAKMSDSRYLLQLEQPSGSGRGHTGLDLAVLDSYTGKVRPCATLSGGESFMASISLALGLADSLQNRSGGVCLDAVFIDEGFGSLDEASLDKAISILDELREHRMVGLISHVSEMRSRIPSHIEVIKTESGSRIAF